MALTIQTVPTLKAAEEQLIAFVGTVRSEPTQRVNILTGSIAQRTYFRRLLGAHFGATANVRFFIPVDLAAEIRRAADAPRGLSLPDGGDVLLIAELLHRLRGNGQLDQLDPDLQGVAEAVRGALNDLREGNISAVEFRRALRRSDARKLHDLATLYEAYESLDVRSAFLDRPALYRDALDDRVSDEAVRSVLGNAPTAVIGLYDAPPVQVALIRRCAEVVDVRVFLVAAAEPEFAFARNFRDVLIKAGATAQADPNRLTDAPKIRAAPAHFSAPTRQAEAEEVARRMLALARDHGVPFNEMAVLHRLDHSYDDLLAAVLSRAGIPIYRGAGHPVRHTAPGRAVLVLLDLLLEPPTRHRLLEFLGNPALRSDIPTLDSAAPSPVRPQPVRWERISKSAGMVTGWKRFKTQLDTYIKTLRDQEDQERRRGAAQAAADLRSVVARLAEAAENVKDLRSWSDYSNWLLHVLDAYLAAEEAEHGPLSVIRSQIEALRQLDRAELAVDAARFHQAAVHAVRRAVESGGFLERDGAFLGNVNAARWLRFQAVFLTECAERIFPSLIQLDPILLDDERETLNRRFERKVLPIKRERAQEEQLLFALVEQSAKRFLTISWARRTTTSGAPRLSSTFLRQSIRSEHEEGATERELVEHGLIRRLPARLAGAAPSPEHLAANDWRAVETALDATDFALALLEAAPSAAPTVLRTLWPDHARYQAARVGRNAPHFSEYDGLVPPDALRRDPLSPSTSATGLEEYATCPYRYFLRRVLRVGAVAEPGEALEMTPLDRGDLVHTILERWITRWIEAGDAGQVDWPTYLRNEEPLMQIAQEEFAAADLSGLAGLPATWDVVREEVLSDLRRLLELERARAEEGYRPVGVEIDFGDLAVSLPDDTELRFRGRIDRVDRGPEGIVAIDYKTGAFRKRAEDYRDGSALQLPIYLLAAAREFGDDPRTARAEYWYATRKGDFARSGLGGATVLGDAVLADALASISTGVRAGRFFPHPGKGVGGRRRPNCTFCDFASACATDVDQRFEAKAKYDQDTVRAFRTLQAQRT